MTVKTLPDIKTDLDNLIVLLIVPSDLKTLALSVRDIVDTLLNREPTRNISPAGYTDPP